MRTNGNLQNSQNLKQNLQKFTKFIKFAKFTKFKKICKFYKNLRKFTKSSFKLPKPFLDETTCGRTDRQTCGLNTRGFVIHVPQSGGSN
jgi:hypothetical protein